VKTNKSSDASNIEFASPIEYLFMGDIIYVCAVSLALFKILNYIQQLISLPTLGPNMVYDPHASALIRVSGPVDSVDPSVFTFTMNLIQHTSYASKGIFPLKIYISENSKW
jgi:hypothetical protein